MKLHKSLLLFGVSVLFLSGCNTKANTEPPTLSITSNEIVTDHNKEATVTGKATPNSIVYMSYDKVGFGQSSDIVNKETVTDEDGFFSFEVDWQTSYVFYAEKDGYTSDEKEVYVRHQKQKEATPPSIKSSAEKKEKNNGTPAGDLESKEVSREDKNALRSAQNYLQVTGLSKDGLYQQLVNYDKFPKVSARYAVDNVDTNWNENALRSAENYLDVAGLSDQRLFEQLVGYDKFTEEQARYAIDNLE